MSLTSSAFAYTWSKWNADCGKDKIIIQAVEQLEDEQPLEVNKSSIRLELISSFSGCKHEAVGSISTLPLPAGLPPALTLLVSICTRHCESEVSFTITTQVIEETGYLARQTSKKQTKMPRFMLEDPRPCTIFYFALIHYA